MLLYDIVRNILFLPISYILDYEVIDEDRELIEEIEHHLEDGILLIKQVSEVY